MARVARPLTEVQLDIRLTAAIAAIREKVKASQFASDAIRTAWQAALDAAEKAREIEAAEEA